MKDPLNDTLLGDVVEIAAVTMFVVGVGWMVVYNFLAPLWQWAVIYREAETDILRLVLVAGLVWLFAQWLLWWIRNLADVEEDVVGFDCEIMGRRRDW